MTKSVFISYSHKQGEWVWKNLVPCLRAGGAEVRIDVERMRAGGNVTAQMNAEQDAADLSVLVLSTDYFKSDYCQHEMQRALACKKFVAAVRADCTILDEIKQTLYVDLRDDKAADKWDMLMRECEADLGTTVPDWLHARDEIVKCLERGESVCLEVKGKVRWRELVSDIQDKCSFDLNKIDLHSGSTISRRGLVEEILRVSGSIVDVPREPGEDLVILQRTLDGRGHVTNLALLHFEIVAERKIDEKYDVNFFATLRNLLQTGKLCLLIQTRVPLNELLPPKMKISPLIFDHMKLVGSD